MKIDGAFYDYCDGCDLADIRRVELGETIPFLGQIDKTKAVFTCKNIPLCARLWDRLQKRITGSVVVEEDEE